MIHMILYIQKTIHETNDLIDFEERVRLLMDDTFASKVGVVFRLMNRMIVK